MIRFFYITILATVILLPFAILKSNTEIESSESIIYLPENIEPIEPIQERTRILDSMVRTSRGERLIFSDTYKILFAGDVMLDWGVEDAIRNYGSMIPFEDWVDVFHSVDRRIVNFESTILQEKREPFPGKAFVFASKFESSISLLKQLKVDAVSLGNNHAMDYQVEGMRDTISILRNNQILTFGAGENDFESFTPIRWSDNGNHVSIFSASDVAEKNFPFSSKKKPGVAFLNESLLKQVQKKEPKEFQSILSLHWGLEYSAIPMNSQRRLAKALLESGYSAIIGHHPHIPQGIEIYKGKPIVYSLGNFIFGSKNNYLTHNIVVILHIKENRIVLLEIIPSFGKFQNFDHIFFPLAPQEAEEFLEEYAILCKKLGTDLQIQGGRGYVFLDNINIRSE